MALTRDKMIEAISTGISVPIYKASLANMAAGSLCSLWRAAGSPAWAQGAIPSTAAAATDDTVGGIALPAFSGKTGRVYRFAPACIYSGHFMLFDRLSHSGGLSGTVTSAQTVSLNVATALAAGRCRSDYTDVQWFVEVYTDVGTTTSNGTVSYTDANNTAGKTISISSLFGASPRNSVGTCAPIVPTDGIPIKSIQTITLSASTGTAGSFGITARKQLCEVGQLLANVCSPLVDAISIGMPEIKETSCLEMLVLCSTTSTGTIFGSLNVGTVLE